MKRGKFSLFPIKGIIGNKHAIFGFLNKLEASFFSVLGSILTYFIKLK